MSLRHLIFVSMEAVFRNQLVSKNQCLRDNALANSFPRNGPHITICWNSMLHRCGILNLMLYHSLEIHWHFGWSTSRSEKQSERSKFGSYVHLKKEPRWNHGGKPSPHIYWASLGSFKRPIFEPRFLGEARWAVNSEGKELFCLLWRSFSLAVPKIAWKAGSNFYPTYDTCCNVCLVLEQLSAVGYKPDVSLF
jgi:hypothetical protein